MMQRKVSHWSFHAISELQSWKDLWRASSIKNNGEQPFIYKECFREMNMFTGHFLWFIQSENSFTELLGGRDILKTELTYLIE